MRVTVIGTGYVGLVTGTCLAEFGHDVVCMDTDKAKIEMLCRGAIPIHEKGLLELVQENLRKKTLHFTTDFEHAVHHADAIFIAVGTPPREDGSADLSAVLSAARSIATYMQKDLVVIGKSTVPVGTARRMQNAMEQVLSERKVIFKCEMVANPEFLREGNAVADFMKPERIIIGVQSEVAEILIKTLYQDFSDVPIVCSNLETAEVIKYASNAFLATKISFINEVSQLCEAVGADVQKIALGMGLDARIGSQFLEAGPGFGGSCFPKDTLALAHIGKKYGARQTIVEAVIDANYMQMYHMVEKIVHQMGSVAGKTIACLGLAFKKNTDDLREAPALLILRELYERGANVVCYDPIAMDNAKRIFASYDFTYASSALEACKQTDAVMILTAWDEFLSLDMQVVFDYARGKELFDFRNCLDRTDMENIGFTYVGVGR